MIKVYGKEGCSNCEKLKKELFEKNINFEYIEDMSKAIELGGKAGIKSLPVVDIEGNIFDYNKTVEYIRSDKI